MMPLLLPWWRDRSPREQVLLAVTGVLLLLVIAWLGILRPLASARTAAEARHAAAVTALADVNAMATGIRRAEKRTAATRDTPLIERISRRAAETGLTTERLETSGDGRVTVRINAVRPPVILRWLADLESRDGIIIDRVAINRNDDATLAVDLALRNGAG